MLDLLRLFAVLAVVLYHYGFRGAAADGLTGVSLPALQSVIKYGYLGVQMFFVISGFVITYSADGRTGAGFAIARIARIYPGFLFCMTVTFVATLALGGTQFSATASQWLANTVIVAPVLKQSFIDGAYWSVVYEIVFYGWVFLFIMLGLFQRRRHLIILVWLMLSLANELALNSGALRKLLLTDNSGFFAAGVLLCDLYRGQREATVFGLFGLAAACAAIEAVTNLNWMRNHFGAPFDDLIVAGLSLAAIAVVAAAVNVRSMPLPSGVVLAIGGLTYPLYLLHQHIGYIAFNALEGLATSAVLITATVGTMLILSYATWRWIERPGQKFVKGVLIRAADRLGIAMQFAPPIAATLPIGAAFPWMPQTLRAEARIVNDRDPKRRSVAQPG